MFDQVYRKKFLNIYNIKLGSLDRLKYVSFYIFHKFSQIRWIIFRKKIKQTII